MVNNYEVVYTSIYLNENECYCKATFISKNKWLVSKQIMDVFLGKEFVTTQEVAQKIIEMWFEDSTQKCTMDFLEKGEGPEGKEELHNVFWNIVKESRRK